MSKNTQQAFHQTQNPTEHIEQRSTKFRDREPMAADLKPVVRRMAICFGLIHVGAAGLHLFFNYFVRNYYALEKLFDTGAFTLLFFSVCFAFNAVFVRLKIIQPIILGLEIVTAVLDKPNELYVGVVIGTFLIVCIVYGYAQTRKLLKGIIFLTAIIALVILYYVSGDHTPDESTPIMNMISTMWLLTTFGISIYLLLKDRAIILQVVDKPVLRISDYGLNQREATIFRLYGENKSSSKEISEIIHLPPATIDKYTQHIAKKLGVRDRKELIRTATKHRLI